MPGKKKKFIDKKNAVTFNLVHRSQRDPLQADDDASQRVLVETAAHQVDHDRKAEQRKYGVFYEDDYDYLQHLLDIDEINDLQPGDSYRFAEKEKDQEPKLQLPSSVFASQLETAIGLLNKAVAVKGPRPDWDPDIVAALDEDFDFSDPENILEDDFMLVANTQGGDNLALRDSGMVDGRTRPDIDIDDLVGSDVASDDAEFSDEDSDGCPGENFDPFLSEETKSRFTNYSLSSSVQHRNQGLTLLDDRFEKLFEQYDEPEIGALDHEEVEGSHDQGSHLLNSILDQFEEHQKQTTLKDVVEPGKVILDSDEDSGVEDKDLVKMEIEEPGQKWDCESILSTYSNIYNHPRLIEEPKKIQLTCKLGIPAGVLEQPGLTHGQIERERRQAKAGDRAPTYRPRGEASDEKRERKQAVKSERKERRAEKKANKVAFRVEEKRQECEIQNVQKNLQGMKIS